MADVGRAGAAAAARAGGLAVRVLLFGATGMIGQGVLRECLADDAVREVVAVGRSATGVQHPRLRELRHDDLFALGAIQPQLSGFDAAFFCLGVTSRGLSEAAYRRITVDLTLAVAGTLARLNPQMTFIYISGAGADASERGRIMWARVKGQAENALLRLPFRRCYLFRPFLIQPTHGIRSRTGWYNAFYTLTAPVLPLLRRLLPAYVTTTELNARAMLRVARDGAPQAILENSDINRIAAT